MIRITSVLVLMKGEIDDCRQRMVYRTQRAQQEELRFVYGAALHENHPLDQVTRAAGLR